MAMAVVSRMLGNVKSVNPTLELLRLKSDLATMFCSVRGFVDIDNCHSLFNVIDCETSYTRGHNLPLFRDRCNLNVVVILLSVVNPRRSNKSKP